jgi:hypothetical protein
VFVLFCQHKQLSMVVLFFKGYALLEVTRLEVMRLEVTWLEVTRLEVTWREVMRRQITRREVTWQEVTRMEVMLLEVTQLEVIRQRKVAADLSSFLLVFRSFISEDLFSHNFCFIGVRLG